MKIINAVAFTMSLAACGSDAVPPEASPPEPLPSGAVTYYQAIKPILDAKCVTCHVDGGIGPFPLDTYASATEVAEAVANAVTSKVMPPWKANSDCRDYPGDRSLDQPQIDAINQWLAEGTLEGDAESPGAPIDTDVQKLSRVDASLRLPEPYTPQAVDDYRCFVLPWPAEYTQTAYVTGFGALPDNDATVHHMIAFVATPADVAEFVAMDTAEAGPGYTCFGGANGPVDGMVGGWAPGTLGSDLPPGIGLRVEPGSAIILQVHYNTTHGSGPDQSEIELKIDSSVEREGRVMPFADPRWPTGNMLIPANDPDVVHSFAFDPTRVVGYDFEIFSAALHMHTLGTSAKLNIQRGADSTATDSCLLQIDDWDFHWQGSYGFTQTDTVRRGDKISIECRWDNSVANQPMAGSTVQMPLDVNWGEGTRDEMCIGFMLTAPL